MIFMTHHDTPDEGYVQSL